MTFVAFVIACFSSTALPTLSWTAVALFCYVRMVLASKWLSKRNIPDQANSPLSVSGIAFACFCLIFLGYFWWIRFEVGQQPPTREELHAVTGELQVRYRNYVVVTPARPVILRCPQPGRAQIKQSCLPENIQNYVGRQVTVLFPEPLEDKWQAVFYEISSGDNVLISYDIVRQNLIERRKVGSAFGAFFSVLVTLGGLSLLIFQWIGYFQARKKRAPSGPASPVPKITIPQ